ncbi:MAG: Non-motile and phage-resistance protein [Bacteroidota bacterium]|jgi:PAS domain S-box-containing protein
MGTESEINFFFSICPDLCCLLADDGTILQVNKIWEEKFDQPLSFFENRKFTDFMTPEDAKLVFARYQERIKGAPSNGSRCQHTKSNGQKFWIEWRASFSPKFHKMYAIGRDVTAQVLLEQELKAAIDTKNKLFSVISHDLKSQLSGLIQMTGMMGDKEYNFSNDELIKYSQMLHVSSKNLHELLENLLNWSKIQRGLFVVEHVLLDLDQVVYEAVDPFRIMAKEKGVDLNVSVQPLIQINGDKQMLVSIIRNLTSNAIKFTPSGGHVEINCHVTDDEIHFDIKDNGIGIPEDLKPKLFKHGEKVTRNGTNGEPSSGLGLIITEEFAKLHNGYVVFSSEINKGTEFEVVIPQR